MANENNNKIPCGGFYLGDGLTMDGNTLKSLGGEQVQTDYAQNDPTAKDYIKNRPGGYEESFEITWDGDTTGRASITQEGAPVAWYKVSDKILTLNQIVGSTLTTVRNGESYQEVITSDQTAEYEFGIGDKDLTIIIATKQGIYTIDGYETSKTFNIPETGIYFVYMVYGGVTGYVSSLSATIPIPFDDKYIPDTIARKAELDSRITEKEVILTSSTTDSTKKFKITVNDSGTLTATEIPE